MKDTGGLAVLLLVLCFVALSPNRETMQHTVYEVYCSDFKSSVYHCPGKLFTSKSTYLAIPETQTIVRDGLPLSKWDNCAVFDAENWTCDTRNEDKRDWDKQMAGGHYTDLSDWDPSESYETFRRHQTRRQASRIEYTIRYFFLNF